MDQEMARTGSRDEALLDLLYRPLRLNGIEIPNRIVMAPMTRKFAVNGVNAESAVGYYRRRAEGGTGLIITEGIATSDIGAHTAQVPLIRTVEQKAVWRRVTDAVHEAGGKILAQLWHAGLGRLQEQAADPTQSSVGAMDIFLDTASPFVRVVKDNPQGRSLKDEAIAATIDEYAIAAADAKDCGFDGVEIHGAHGYLIDQFLWGETNRRSDGWGGDIRQRTRFGTEVIKAIRARTDRGFVIGFRFSQWKSPYLYDVKAWPTPAELEQALRPLADAGLDFLDASTRRYWTAEFEGSDMTIAGWAKKITGLPSMAIGSVGIGGAFEATNKNASAEPENNLNYALEMMARDEIDLLGVGRALLANPQWAKLVREGRQAELKLYNAEVLATHI